MRRCTFEVIPAQTDCTEAYSKYVGGKKCLIFLEPDLNELNMF